MVFMAIHVLTYGMLQETPISSQQSEEKSDTPNELLQLKEAPNSPAQPEENKNTPSIQSVEHRGRSNSANSEDCCAVQGGGGQAESCKACLGMVAIVAAIVGSTVCYVEKAIIVIGV